MLGSALGLALLGSTEIIDPSGLLELESLTSSSATLLWTFVIVDLRSED